VSLSQFVLRREKACLFPTKNDNLLYTQTYCTLLFFKTSVGFALFFNRR